MEDLTAGQLRRAFDVVGHLSDLRDLREFPARSAQLLRQLIPCDHAGYNAIDVGSRRAIVAADPADVVFTGGPDVLARFADQSPVIRRAMAGDTTVLRMSDLISSRELHRTDIYDLVYRLISLEYQLAVQLPPTSRALGGPRELVGFSLARYRRDFSEGDRRLLHAMRRHFATTLERLHELALVQATRADPTDEQRGVLLIDRGATVAWASPAAAQMLAVTPGDPLPEPLRAWVVATRAHAVLHTNGGSPDRGCPLDVAGHLLRPRLVADAYPLLDALHLTPADALPHAAMLRSLGLTARQAEVLALAVRGGTSKQIAQDLTLSTRTVEKHLEAIYGRLGVSNRTEATVMALTARGAARTA